MELHLPSHTWEYRVPDWSAAAVSGFAAGAVLMVLELLWSLLIGSSPWQVSHSVAAIVLGPQVLSTAEYGFGVVAAALALHYALGIVFGLIIGGLMAGFRLDSSVGVALLSGALFGVLLYLFDFYVMVHAFPWFAAMRGWPTLVAHLVFGIVAAVLYRQLEWSAAAR